ncbi:MAG: carboxypeptidase-like regulatory domain-containing protein [Bacteroidota bacterium]
MKPITLTAIALSCFVFTHAQMTVRGVVSDRTGVLPEAHVYIKGSDEGTLTDINGTYQLDVTKGDTIVVSYLGYEPQEIEVKEDNFHEVVLEGESLDEVLLWAPKSRRIRCRTYCYNTCISTTGYFWPNVESTQLYPNPSPDGRFHLKFLEEYDQVDMMVSNILGQTIRWMSAGDVDGDVPIDLSQFPSGIYLISIRADGKILKTQKAIKK